MNYAAMERERAREGEKFAWAEQSISELGAHGPARSIDRSIHGTPSIKAPDISRYCWSNYRNARGERFGGIQQCTERMHGCIGGWGKREFHAFQIQN